jgi:hypothetical protein
MGNIIVGGKSVSCDFCGTGTQDLQLLIRDPSKGSGSSRGSKTKSKICRNCLEEIRNRDDNEWQRRIDSGRYAIEDLEVM